jgi:hypothetical protein
MGSQPVRPPLQNNRGQPVQQPNPYQPTYGELAFGSSGVPPNSTYKIAPASNRLQKNMYGGGYHEVMTLLTLSQILGTVQLQECKTMIFSYRKWLI